MSSLSTDSVHAAIDIGTNSMHLLIAKLNSAGGLEILQTDRESTRLGAGMGKERKLTEEAIERGLVALKRFRQLAESQNATISAIATSAVREAKNQQDFLQRAKNECNINVQVISGLEEARLIHAGVIRSLDIYQKRTFVFDIGGGSSELVIAQKSDLLQARSMKLGCVKLTDQFFPEGQVTPQAVIACRNHIRNNLAAVKTVFSKYLYDTVVGCSGTVSAVAQMIATGKGTPLRHNNGATFTVEELHTLTEKILTTSPEKRHKIPGLESKRLDIITGGIVLLSELAIAFGFSEITVSNYALREGILFDRLLGDTSNPTTSLRVRNVEKLVTELDPDPEHAKNVARLSLELFDQTANIHQLGTRARDLLDKAALLHNIGLSVSNTGHHKHSYYLIRHSDSLTGFTEQERELMAIIARYHRRARPTKKHAAFAELQSEDKYTVRCLAGILRIAIGLDRRHNGAIGQIAVEKNVEKNILTIEISSEIEKDLELELYAATDRAALLEETYGTKIELKLAKSL